MAKKKGDLGGNPNPVMTAEFKAHIKQAQGVVDGELATKPLSVKVVKPIDEAVRKLPQRAAWLRRVITEAAERELMGGEG